MKSFENHGLTKMDLFSIAKILYQNQKITQVLLFGSRAMGKFHKGSDIDMALKGKDLLLPDILNLYIDLDDLYLPYKFDLLIYHNIKEKASLDHIKEHGILLDTSESKINTIISKVEH